MRHFDLVDRQWLRKASRELMAAGAISAIGVGYLGLTWETEPSTILVGQITGFGLVEQKGYGQVGSIVRAQVDLSYHRAVSVTLPDRSHCRIGSKIEIEEAHTFFGSRFKAGRRECFVVRIS